MRRGPKNPPLSALKQYKIIQEAWPVATWWAGPACGCITRTDCKDAAYCYQCSVVCVCVCWTQPQNGWTDRDVVWVVDSGGPREPCIGRDPDLLKKRLWGRRAPHAMRPFVKIVYHLTNLTINLVALFTDCYCYSFASRLFTYWFPIPHRTVFGLIFSSITCNVLF